MAEGRGYRTSHGFGRLLVAVYGVFAISTLARSLYQIGAKFDQAPVAYLLSAFAAAVYLVATVALAKGGRKWWPIAATAVMVELVGVLVVGLITSINSVVFADDTVWSHFGEGYGFIPLVLPIVGMVWIYATRGSSGRTIRR